MSDEQNIVDRLASQIDDYHSAGIASARHEEELDRDRQEYELLGELLREIRRYHEWRTDVENAPRDSEIIIKYLERGVGEWVTVGEYVGKRNELLPNTWACREGVIQEWQIIGWREVAP